MDNQAFYFPWVRKGLGGYIDEKESLGKVDGSKAKARAELVVKSNFNVQHNQASDGTGGGKSAMFLEKTVKFIGPGDILRVNPAAIMKVHPQDGSEGFPRQYLPYIEFWEPDFLWRYTPAAQDNNKLRPWLLLVVLQEKDVRLFSNPDGTTYFSFTGDDAAWSEAFLKVEDQFRCAHAQGHEEKIPEFCRLLGMRNEDDLCRDTEYIALLVPAYETGRLRGLGYTEDDIKDTIAQQASWENSFSEQKKRNRGLEFPVYYKWYFKTGLDKFDDIAARLKGTVVKKSGLTLDVTDMGEGFSYDTVESGSSRTSIVMPAATSTLDAKTEKAFPAKNDPENRTETILYEHLEDRLSVNPVFAENIADIEGKPEIAFPDGDDPWIVPPVYGARHAMSTELHDKTRPWMDELNMDIHNRAAAGMGRKVVQKHQEELMDRAWKQVEAVQALNMELYKRLLSIQANRSLQRKTVDSFSDSEKYIEYMMQYLASMKNAGGDNISLSDIIHNAGIPMSFASSSFQNNAKKMSKIVAGLDTTSLMGHIVQDQIFKYTPPTLVDALHPDTIIKWCREGKEALAYNLQKKYFSDFYKVTFSPVQAEDGKTYTKCTFKEDDCSEYWTKKPETAFLSDMYPSSRRYINYDTKDEFHIMSLLLERHYRVNYSNPDVRYYPKVYVMPDNDFSSIFSRHDTSLSEGPTNSSGGLGYSVNGKTKILYPSYYAIPDEWYSLFFDGALFDPVSKSSSSSKFGLSKTNLPSSDSIRYVFQFAQGGYTAQKTSSWDGNGYEYCKGHINYNAEPACAQARMKQIRQLLKSLHEYGHIKSFGKVVKSFYDIVKDYRTEAESEILRDNILDFQKLNVVTIKSTSKAWQGFKNNWSYFMSDAKWDNPAIYAQDGTYIFLSMILVILTEQNMTSLFRRMCEDVFGYNSVMMTLSREYDIGGYILTMLFLGLVNHNESQNDLRRLKEIGLSLRKTPTYIVVSESYVKQQNVVKGTTTDGISDFIRKVVPKQYPDECKYLDDVMEKAKQLTESMHPAPKPEPPKVIDTEAVDDLKNDIKNEKAYERIVNVASDYYTFFYSDSLEGERLRDAYLDDLLRSKYPILAYPFFPEPTYYYLNMLSDKFILPGLAEIPMDHIAVFKNNPKFTEAFLCGMNTEMGSELQWREYPTDRRGSYFRKFWDSESNAAAIQNNKFFDVHPLHLWGKTRLGENHMDGKSDLLIFAVRSDLFRLYPNTRVYLNKAKKGEKEGDVAFDLEAEKIEAVMESFLREDTVLVGFNKKIEDVLGNPDDDNYGYMLTFEQDLDDLNFTNNKETRNGYKDSAATANGLKDQVSVYGKHVSLFV